MLVPPGDDVLTEQTDQTYRSRYARYGDPYVSQIVESTAKAATRPTREVINEKDIPHA